MKKGLAVLLAFALVLGSMSGVVFAKETVDVWDGTADTSWYNETDTEFTLTTAEQLAGLAVIVDGGNTFAGKTITLGNDINLYAEDDKGNRVFFQPIGDASNADFSGIFDGGDNTIYNLRQDCNSKHLALFGAVYEGTVKNLTIDGALIENDGSGYAAAVAAYAGAANFENITLRNTTVVNYNHNTAGIVAWCSNNGTTTAFDRINIESTTTIGSWWGSYDTRVGGIVGAMNTGNEVVIKNSTVACRLDVYNDVTSNYQWHNYRTTGMIVADVRDTITIDGREQANPNRVTCENVTVEFNEWANYHYCESSSYGTPSYADEGEYKFNRVEAGLGYGGVDLAACDHANDETHNMLIAVDELFGVRDGKGLYSINIDEYNAMNYTGVTVDYNAAAFLTKGEDEAVEKHYSLQSAIDAAVPGDVIDLKRDVTENIVINDAVTFAMRATNKITINLNGYKIIAADSAKPALTSGKPVAISGGEIKGDIISTASILAIDGINHTGSIQTTSNDASILITSGIFSDAGAADYLADGYELTKTADGYLVIEDDGEFDADTEIDGTQQASSISVEYKDITAADAEGEKTYEIVLKANDGDTINELASADLTFVYTTAPTVGGAIDFTVAPAKNFSMSRVDKTNRYMFNYDGVGAFEGSGNAITIGTIKVEGYGKFTIATKEFDATETDTNIVNATTLKDNLVDSYTAAGAKDTDATTGALVINTDTVANDGMVGSITNGAIAVPTRELTINIAFPNAVVDKAAAYQDMKVEITGNIEGVNQTVKYDLGGNMTADGKYVVTEDRLVLNNAYTVTVSGAGYRTARYTVTMTDDKELNFWNNVMDEKKAVEPGKASSEVTKNFLAGDIVKDNQINIYDLSAVVSYFASTSDVANGYAKYDLNRDGVIDSKDVAYVLVSWGE